MQTLSILGSTGSIGVSTLDVVARHPEQFQIFALAGHSQTAKLAEQCRQFAPRYAVVADEARAAELRQLLGSLKPPIHTEILHGKQALIDIATAPEVTGVMCAIVGAAGLPSALAAAAQGKTIYLANKETLVVAGSLFMHTAQQHGATILPIDSEHNAIFQVLPRDYSGSLNAHGIASIILTASGGSFLHTDLADFPRITPAQAVKHPNWSMGQKISVDSSTMMNKGLELIEARWLFNCPPSKLEVVIHPQSVIHSMVRYADGSVLAQLGTPDMRVPIAYGLAWPQRMASGSPALDFGALQGLTFEDMQSHGHPARFPSLALVWQVLRAPEGACAIFNAANEVAVEAFLQGRIRFDQIHAVIQSTLEAAACHPAPDLPALLALDASARRTAQEAARKLA